jgi:hypothetical protein
MHPPRNKLSRHTSALLVIISFLVLLLILLARFFQLLTITAARRRASRVLKRLLVLVPGLAERLAVAAINLLAIGVVDGDHARFGTRGRRRVVIIVVVCLINNWGSGGYCGIGDLLVGLVTAVFVI